ncbi:MAG TPA: hypothetical protein VGK20_18200 [Candidatus Binatia bacterium]
MWVDDQGTLDVSGNISTLTATISKGKAKTVFRVDATITIGANAHLPGLFLALLVNGDGVHPNFALDSQCDTTATVACTMAASFWLDIDAAEAASPGGFVGKPLVISLSGGNTADDPTALNYTVSLSGQVIKK